VHALRHVHTLLVPQGTLVDLHPVTEEHVEADGNTIGVVEDPGFLSVDLPNAESRLQESMRDGLFALEGEVEFDFLQYFDEVQELSDATQERLAAQTPLARRIRAANPPVVLREHCVLRRLRAC
jgi:hypothetical protein